MTADKRYLKSMTEVEVQSVELAHSPSLGDTAPSHAGRTARKLAGFALERLGAIRTPEPARGRYLDVGCGNGFITSVLAPRFREVCGIDVEPERLAEFRARTGDDPRFDVREVRANAIPYPDEHFGLVTSFEVLEHVDDLPGAAAEIVRVLAPGGLLVVSVPQIGFPIETHGMRVGRRIIDAKIPLLPWIRPLHRRIGLARVFRERELDSLFLGRRLEAVDRGFAAPQFERAAAKMGSWESRVAFLRELLEWAERVPGLRRLVGVSMLKAYRKPPDGA